VIYSIAMLKHHETGRFHPCYLTWAPLPGGPEAQKDMPKRWRSRAHHTDGVDTEEEADVEMKKIVDWLKERMGGDPRVDFGTIEWDGSMAFNLLSGPEDERKE